jgi:hypothetical protein
MARFIYIFYVSKLYEFGDTVSLTTTPMLCLSSSTVNCHFAFLLLFARPRLVSIGELYGC